MASKGKDMDLTAMLRGASSVKEDQKVEEKAFRDLRSLSARYEDMIRLHGEAVKAAEDFTVIDEFLKEKLPAVRAAIKKKYEFWKEAKQKSVFPSIAYDVVSKVCEYALDALDAAENEVIAMRKKQNSILAYHNESVRRLPELVLEITNLRLEVDVLRKTKEIRETYEAEGEEITPPVE